MELDTDYILSIYSQLRATLLESHQERLMTSPEGLLEQVNQHTLFLFRPIRQIFPLAYRLPDVESKRGSMKNLNCLMIQEKENTRLIYREKTMLGKAKYHNLARSRLPVPKLGLLLSMGAGEAHGGYEPPGQI